MSDHETYTLTIQALPRPTPGDVRLRALLKLMLRGYGLKCTGVVPVKEAEPTGPGLSPPAAGRGGDCQRGPVGPPPGT